MTRGSIPLNGGNLPSVTTVLGVLQKFGLVPWAAAEAAEKIRPLLAMIKSGMVNTAEIDIDKIMALAENAHKEKKVEAADIGKKMHVLIADYYRMLRNGSKVSEAGEHMLPVVYEQLEQRVTQRMGSLLLLGRRAWVQPHPHRNASHENHFLYGGTMDFYGLNKKDKFYVIDWKSANAIYPETTMQVAAYSNALMETDPRVERIDGWGVPTPSARRTACLSGWSTRAMRSRSRLRPIHETRRILAPHQQLVLQGPGREKGGQGEDQGREEGQGCADVESGVA
ncbi:MAG: hypothetical protein MZV49_24080 [Rhodopseudomonas palustris]|nr:hypothetical protein [Rhodopseudomonas palustris]